MQENSTLIKESCYHCGEKVEDLSIYKEDKHFCCHGCKTVFELLQENDLCEYYSLENAPGTQLKDFFAEKYRFLENEEIASLLLDFKTDSFQKVTFYVPAIHCSSCIWLLENLQRFDDGIINSQINFSRKKLTINLNPAETSIKKVVDLLCQLGYEPEINLEQKPEQLTRSNAPMLKLGIAGFVFGNIMLLYFPDYLGLQVSSEFRRYFTYISLALSIPVFTYCASSFYFSAFSALRKKILNIDLPISLGLGALFLRSVFDIITTSGPGYLDSLAGLVFFLLIGRWFQDKTYEGMSFERNYKSYFPLAVTRVNDNTEESVLVENIKLGDTLNIRNDEIIPCDSKVITDIAQIDYSFVTGESDPVTIKAGDFVYAGGRIKGKSAQFKVEKEVSNSYLTQLWNEPEHSPKTSSQFYSLVDHTSRYFTPVVLAIAVLASIYWFVVDSGQVLYVFSSVLIIACPCALALATPFTLNAIMNALGRHKMFLKNTSVIEELWRIKKIVFDKTGTITNHRLNSLQLNGNLTEKEKVMVGALASQSTHPLSRSIAQDWYKKDEFVSVENIQETEGAGILGKIDGIKIEIGSAQYAKVDLDITSKSAVVHIRFNNEYRGYVSIGNGFRKGIENAIGELSHKYKLALLSGDNDAEKVNLERFFPKKSDLRFHQSPTDKLEYIQQETTQQPIMMIGDGLNDAGALHSATVGISITDDMASFTPASKIILHGEALRDFPLLLNLSNYAKTIIIIGFCLSFLYNAVGISFAVMGWVSPIFAAILMPISSISVVLFSTLSVRWLTSRYKFTSSWKF